MKTAKPYSNKSLQQDIIKNARSLGLPEKWSATIAKETAHHVDQWIKTRGVVTTEDIERKVCKKLQTYNPDLAYIYKNRGKIL